MANILADNLRPLYPLPELVRPLPTLTIGEVRRTRAPAVLAELGYHDNADDANWLTENLDAIAAALSEGVTQYYGLPFLTPGTPQTGTVRTDGGTLSLREYPLTDAAVLTEIPNGAQVNILGAYDSWYTVEYSGLYGFAAAAYIFPDAQS